MAFPAVNSPQVVASLTAARLEIRAAANPLTVPELACRISANRLRPIDLPAKVVVCQRFID